MVCLYLAERDLTQWNTVYAAQPLQVAFVLRGKVIATLFSRGPASNPIQLSQPDGQVPPVALENFLGGSPVVKNKAAPAPKNGS